MMNSFISSLTCLFSAARNPGKLTRPEGMGGTKVISQIQKEKMLQVLECERYREFAKVKSTVSKTQSEHFWNLMTKSLNNLPGPMKMASDWRKACHSHPCLYEMITYQLHSVSRNVIITIIFSPLLFSLGGTRPHMP